MPDMPNPPKGSFEKAEKYIQKLVSLIEQNNLEVVHTDLNKFDPGSMQDHYRVDLKDYQIELSHSKQPNTGKDSYVMIFTNLKNISEGSSTKAILAYTQLQDSQFHKFKSVADKSLEKKRLEEEEKRFNEALAPLDQLLDQASAIKPVENKSDENIISEELSSNLEHTLEETPFSKLV